jgi:hypothetical protein
MQGTTKVSDAALDKCVAAFDAWNKAGEACAEKAKASAEEDTEENREALATAAQARAKAHQALAQARLRFHAAVATEFGARILTTADACGHETTKFDEGGAHD